MMKHLTAAAVVVTALAIPAGVSLAQGGPPLYGGPPWGWRADQPYGYYSGSQVDSNKVDAAAKETLDKATKGESWTSPGGVKLTPLLVDNKVVGQIWEDADPKTLVVGSFWAGPWGINVQLVKDGKVIGMIWVKVS